VLLQALMVEIVTNLEKIQYVIRLNLIPIWYLASIDIVNKHLKSPRFDPLRNDKSLSVWSLHIILILVHVLVFFECFLEILRGCSHD